MSVARMLLEAEQDGVRSAQSYRHDPSTARDLELGAFSANSRASALLLRRALLAMHVPPGMLAWARSLVRRQKRLAQVDTFLRRYAYWRGVRRGIRDRESYRRLSRAPVILMYHAVGDGSEAPSWYVVPEHRFRMQMAWLRLCRYRVISLSALVADLRRNRLPPARAVVVTFDDGYADTYHLALATLRSRRIPATLFLVSHAIGGHANWTTEPALSGRPLLSAAQIQEMLAAGMEAGAHTRTHVSLTDMPAGGDRERQIAGSREDLERALDRPVRVFAYPFGDYDADAADMVRRAGFHAACCSRSGVNDPATPHFELRRVEVRGTDSLFRFAFMVWSGRRVRRSARARARGPAAPESAERRQDGATCV